jgi:hypothetical protein
MADISSAPPPSRRTRTGALPDGFAVDARFKPEFDLRSAREREIRLARERLADLKSDVRAEGFGEGRAKAVQDLAGDVSSMQTELRLRYLPRWYSGQLLFPQPILRSRMFHVRGKQQARSNSVALELVAGPPIGLTYVGPELRQHDALVFASVCHVGREFPVGEAFEFPSREFCLALGSCGGSFRSNVLGSLERLQAGSFQMEGAEFPLLNILEFARERSWTARLDPRLAMVYSRWPFAWLRLQTWLDLPEGLASWLYGYVLSQTTLIPTPLSLLQGRCGSMSTVASFRDQVKLAMPVLARAGVVDVHWAIKGAALHWRRPAMGQASPRPATR